jgi:hypothetical protein
VIRRFFWPLLFAALLACATPVVAFWQSRDSGYNLSSGGAAAFSGPGDVVSGAKAWWGLRAYSLAQAGTKAANVCNSGDANCANVNTLANGNFDVATAQGAPLSCGGGGGTCTIKTLYDQSAALSCTGSVACDLSNATPASRPTLVFNCLGSLPCMAFSGTQSLSQTITFAAANAQPVTLSAVQMRTGNFTTSQSTNATTSVNGPELGFGSSANTAAIFAGSTVTLAATDSAAHAIQGLFSGASSIINVDGVDSTPGNAGAQGLQFETEFGGDGFGVSMVGRMFEGGNWSVGFTGTQRTNMCHNQFTYWGTATSC